MLKRFISIILLFALICSGFSRFFVYAGFEMNSKYIASNLCENKSRPWMHCNGKCYLMKKLQQADEKEKKQEQQERKARYQEAMPKQVLSLVLIYRFIKIKYPKDKSADPVGRSACIFHPPPVAA